MAFIVEINGVNYFAPESREDVTLQDAIDMEKFIDDYMPPGLKTFYFSAESEKKELALKDLSEQKVMRYFREFLIKFMKLPRDISNMVPVAGDWSMQNLHDLFLKVIVWPKDEEVEATNIIIGTDGDTYYHHPDQINAIGDTTPFKDLTYGEWEAAQTIRSSFQKLKKGHLSALPYMFGVMFRKKTSSLLGGEPIYEKYNPDFLDKRAKMFSGISLQKALNAYFFFAKEKTQSLQTMQQFLKEAEAEGLLAWSGLDLKSVLQKTKYSPEEDLTL